MSSSTEIKEFLSKVSTSLKNNNYKILDKRVKYMSTLAQLGIIEQDVIDDIRTLTINENWIKEPDNNPVYPGDVWICQKNLHGACIYIKLKIKVEDNDLLLVMSYHIDGM